VKIDGKWAKIHAYQVVYKVKTDLNLHKFLKKYLLGKG